ncbi:uncharacterized protein LOC117295600 [Asterias rubens]|uniref:uncharacterized protein LOC117295600 n=1 Tax=Asterias rubens TaxID=7604 RepID=UPI0014553847|nr:uncharacterized protein LOC117295600 [Asterias rubens]
MDAVKDRGILGMDFLLPTNGRLDFKDMVLTLNGERIGCQNGQGANVCARVTVEVTVEVPPGHEALVSGRVSRKFTGLGVMEPAETTELASRGLIVAWLLVKPEEEMLPIRVFNPGRRTCVVKGGSGAGILTPVEGRDVQEPDVVRAREEIGQLPAHLEDLYSKSTAGVAQEYHGEIARLLLAYQDIFSKGSEDIGHTDRVRHHIDTGDARPIRERPRRFPTVEQEEISRQVQELLKEDKIAPSSSPWAANVVLVKKEERDYAQVVRERMQGAHERLANT